MRCDYVYALVTSGLLKKYMCEKVKTKNKKKERMESSCIRQTLKRVEEVIVV